ncbi:class I SAM-dependent methyltransferase [Nocardia sp. NPDC047648]|uniref:class I SAM-dependent methyltransferase n=1 Tax=Nocardia sp. NPDC047648 TaxID=3155625 RepID=UPI0033D5AAFB
MRNRGSRVFDWNSLPAGYAARYEHLNEEYGKLYSTSAERLMTISGISRGDVVIDLGAGSGFSTEILADRVGRRGHILAVDPSIPMLERARERAYPCPITFHRGEAESIHSIAEREGFLGCDAIFSSFTYYYTFHDRPSLHRAVFDVLRTGGRWAFNLTKYLGEIRIAGKEYNKFGEIYVDRLKSTVARHGIDPGIRNDESSGQFTDTAWEAAELQAAGFVDVEIEAWPLPLTPSQAFRFTLDGFYSHGSRVTFLPALMNVPIGKRIALMREALADCADELDSHSAPHIANVVARRPELSPTNRWRSGESPRR